MRTLLAPLLVLALLSCGGEKSPGSRVGQDPDNPPVEGEPIPETPEGTGPTGPRHEHYIRSEFYKRLVIELDYVAGKLPSAEVEAALAEGYSTLLDKPEGIVVEHDQMLVGEGKDHVWTFEALNALAQAQFDREVPVGTIKIHTLFVDGTYEDPNVLGIAWASRYVVIFKDRLDELCNASLGGLSRTVCNEAVRGVWMHELGHVIGLVNNGLAMQTPHQDTAHGGHDHNEECIMYWAYETPSLLDRLFSGKSSAGFDAACLEDLKAVRER